MRFSARWARCSPSRAPDAARRVDAQSPLRLVPFVPYPVHAQPSRRFDHPRTQPTCRAWLRHAHAGARHADAPPPDDPLES
jgi:hypothetical protein